MAMLKSHSIYTLAGFVVVSMAWGCSGGADKDMAAAQSTVVSPEKAKALGLGGGHKPIMPLGGVHRGPVSGG